MHYLQHMFMYVYFDLQSLNPGMDNSLSSYMNQRSKTGEFWKERWFVLTIATQTLICYDNHLVRNAID